MKKIFLATMLLGFTTMSFNSSDKEPFKVDNVQSSSFTILNDTKEAVSIHTGAGFVTLQKGSKTNVTCAEGKEVRMGEGGKKGDLIFKIESKMCGTTVKLSQYL